MRDEFDLLEPLEDEEEETAVPGVFSDDDDEVPDSDLDDGLDDDGDEEGSVLGEEEGGEETDM